MTTSDRKVEGYIYPQEFFQKNKPSITAGLCFVIMPFEEKLNEVYNAIAKALQEYGLSPLRADRIFDTRPIMISIMQKMGEAEVIIADVTDRNPNVFYELGMAHVVKDKVILITQKMEDVPFDLRHFRHITYGHSEVGLSKLRRDLVATLTALGIQGKHQEALSSVGGALVEPVGEPTVPEPLSTTITFATEENRERLHARMFAIITNWVDYEKVASFRVPRYLLDFPGGSFDSRGDAPTLKLMRSSLPLKELLGKFGEKYQAIRFELDTHFDLGELRRRSRNDVRSVQEVTTTKMTFDPGVYQAQLIVENTKEGSHISIITLSEMHLFRPDKPPIAYAAVRAYLEKDPPTDELKTAIEVARGE